MRDDTLERRAAAWTAAMALTITMGMAAAAAGQTADQPAGQPLAATGAETGAIAAQVRRGAVPAPQPGAHGWGAWELRPFGELAVDAFSAKNSFDAVTGSSIGFFYGGGIDLSLGRHLLVIAGVTHYQKTGERAFVYNGESFRLGVPLRLSVTPLSVNLAYRLRGRFRPYVGGGVSAVLYRETSDYSSTGEDVSTTGTGFQAVGGLEIPLARRLSLAVEGQYQSIRGVLGDSGVSQAFGEKDLGGASARVRLIFGK
jgi:opacity protein-like surface antigen